MPIQIPIISGIIDLVNGAIDKIFPDATKKAEMKHEFNKYLLEVPFEQWKLFNQRIITEYQNPCWFRDLVRPVITYSAWLTYMFYKGFIIYFVTKFYLPILSAIEPTIENLPTMMAHLQNFVGTLFTWYDLSIISGILAFWFGPKAFERISEKLAGLKSIKSIFLGGDDA